MARKPVQFDIEFYNPDTEEGRSLFSDTFGEIHMNLVRQVLDKKALDINKKKKLYTDVQNLCMEKSKSFSKNGFLH